MSTCLNDGWIGANGPKSAGRGEVYNYKLCSYGNGMSRGVVNWKKRERGSCLVSFLWQYIGSGNESRSCYCGG